MITVILVKEFFYILYLECDTKSHMFYYQQGEAAIYSYLMTPTNFPKEAANCSSALSAPPECPQYLDE